jgi:hypothetical protein
MYMYTAERYLSLLKVFIYAEPLSKKWNLNFLLHCTSKLCLPKLSTPSVVFWDEVHRTSLPQFVIIQGLPAFTQTAHKINLENVQILEQEWDWFKQGLWTLKLPLRDWRYSVPEESKMKKSVLLHKQIEHFTSCSLVPGSSIILDCYFQNYVILEKQQSKPIVLRK